MIWGKIIGGLVGFALLTHNVLGLVLGAVIGHWVDKTMARGRKSSPTALFRADATVRQRIFSTSVINLAAKLAKADGPVTRDEVDAFKALFRIPKASMAGIGALYDEAKRDPTGYESHAQALADAFPGETVLLGEVLEALHQIALVDGRMTPPERQFLERVATIFGLVGRVFAEQAGQTAAAPDAYAILGVARNAATADIKAAWRRLTREHHPDTLMAKGVPPEYVEMATKKMASINAAWDSICRERGES